MATIAFLSAYVSEAQLPAGFVQYQIAGGLNPTDMALSPDGRVFITEKNGVVRLVENGAMLHDPRVRVVSFTGSTEVGRVLLREAAHNIIKPAMELGGNAPFLVFEDADIDAAVEGAMIAKMRNMGEACTAANRFYVHEKVHDEFAKKLTGKMQALKMGNGLDEGVNVGPLVNKEGRDKVGSTHARRDYGNAAGDG